MKLRVLVTIILILRKLFNNHLLYLIIKQAMIIANCYNHIKVLFSRLQRENFVHNFISACVFVSCNIQIFRDLIDLNQD